MKKFVFFLSIALLTLSCEEEKELSNPTILKGSIIDPGTDTIAIRQGDYLEKIALNEDDSFADTLEIPGEGYYTLVVDNEITTLFLSPENTHIVSLDKNLFDETLEYSGDNAAENNYLAQKFLLSEKIGLSPMILRTMPEDSLILVVEQNRQKYLDLLNSFEKIDTGFVSLEEKALDYKNRMTRELYVLYNEKGYYRPGEDGETPSYEAILVDEIDLDNAEDYELYDDYRQLVSLNFYKETSLLNPEDSASFTEKAFRYIENLDSENIKNDLLNQVAYRIRPGGEDNEEIYSKIMAVASDEVFKKELAEKFETIEKLDKGNPSPTFTYENHKGGETSLDSLKGKYVYIDVWATWCGPCLREIPDLKKIEEEYKGENIYFVSLSIDTEEDYEKWKKMVTEKELGGIQVIADNAWDSEFIQNYAINGIPRFILLDPEGRIVSADAPRPSNPELKELFKSLEI